MSSTIYMYISLHKKNPIKIGEEEQLEIGRAHAHGVRTDKEVGGKDGKNTCE
jgi:hypothetical protein